MKRPPTILIVEDDSKIRKFLEWHIKTRMDGCSVVSVDCEEGARKELGRHRKDPFLDLVLLDLRLPEKRGGQALDDIGNGIVKIIRDRRYTKMGSRALLPIIMMTAFGSEEVVSKLFVERAIDDYISKPFGREPKIIEKIERALKGGGAIVPTVGTGTVLVQLAFDHDECRVRVEGIEYDKANYRLLSALGKRFERNLVERRRLNSYEKMSAEDLSKEMNLKEENLRQQVTRFRKKVQQDYSEQLGGTIVNGQIIENNRDGSGYRLNPMTVRLVDWESEES